MDGPFTTLHHVCIVVRDAAATAASYESLGVGPWHDYPPLVAYEELDVPDLDGFRGLVFKFATLGNVQLQVCQPGMDDSPQRRFLDAHGEGVFHLGFDVADCDAGEAAGHAMGLATLMRGRRADRSGFTFFDTAARAGGIVLEVRSSPAPSAAKA